MAKLDNIPTGKGTREYEKVTPKMEEDFNQAVVDLLENAAKY